MVVEIGFRVKSIGNNPLSVIWKILGYFAGAFVVLLLGPAVGGVMKAYVATQFLDLGFLLVVFSGIFTALLMARLFKDLHLEKTTFIYWSGLVIGIFYTLAVWVWFYLFLQVSGIVDIQIAGLDASGAFWPWEDFERFQRWIENYVFQEGKRTYIFAVTYLAAKLGFFITLEVPGFTGNWLYAFWIFEAWMTISFVAFSFRDEFEKGK